MTVRIRLLLSLAALGAGIGAIVVAVLLAESVL
jgi:hypothetical protein